MSKKLTKNQSNKALLKDKSAENGKELVKRLLRIEGCKSEKEFEKAFDLILDSRKNDKKGKKARKQLEGNFGKSLLYALNLDTKSLASLSVDNKYLPFLVEMIDELEKEYNVNTTSEKAIVQTAALSFVQFLRYSSLFNVNAPGEWSTNSQFLSVLSKEIDRAYRHFTSSIQLLKQMKEPVLKVNVKTNSAFIGQNQQFNNQPQNEINTP